MNMECVAEIRSNELDLRNDGEMNQRAFLQVGVNWVVGSIFRVNIAYGRTKLGRSRMRNWV